MEKMEIKVGSNHTLDQIVRELADLFYERTEQTPSSGQFQILGGLLRVFPVNEPGVSSIDFFGNEIDKISDFNNQKVSFLSIMPNQLLLSDGAKVHPGDYLVHEDHGIGLFERISIKKVGKEEIEYINIQYLNGDMLYVPFSQIAKLSNYIGVGRKHPRLSRLGSSAWQKNYHKIYEDVLKVARELLSIYAKREISSKTPLIFNDEWAQKIFATFQFTETEDQGKAIGDVYADLQRSRPMDRLICGDVGFGKTEVAIRAAAQVVANGYQVAILVPTTILAEQHYVTFKNRFVNLPVRIERMSRFLNATENDLVSKDASLGNVDIVIGTHKIIRSNIRFKNLGLLIIDEEQKFGVKDKESLKHLKESVDVLTLTATPIPRTLFMSLSGIRDISQISSIPKNRKPIRTESKVFDKSMITSYISRELGRGGQVYYLHNDVSSIGGRANWLIKQFPTAKIGIAHGQMPERQLSDIMSKFADSEIDILVCSTIIENGLDLPNANTLIVDESDKFGLSQLYQIRGRIGRSKIQSYALFTHKDKKLTENAVKRLRAILENTELGKGFDLALSDLEIRGGGNILGRQQHGNMEAVGLVLYSKLLKLAVNKIRIQ